MKEKREERLPPEVQEFLTKDLEERARKLKVDESAVRNLYDDMYKRWPQVIRVSGINGDRALHEKAVAELIRLDKHALGVKRELMELYGRPMEHAMARLGFDPHDIQDRLNGVLQDSGKCWFQSSLGATAWLQLGDVERLQGFEVKAPR